MNEKAKAPQIDWQQVVLNGGPPCFAQLDDEAGWYCGRAQRWEGHDGEHKFVSLDDLLTTARKEVFKEAIAVVMERGEILHRGNLVAALERAAATDTKEK